MQRVIIHIDFDSFFASVEQQHNPLLRGKPIGVTAVNGRNCIIAASREAKKYGVGTASTRAYAYTVCPEIQLVGADFVKYWEISKKFIAICKNYSPLLEVFSIDELFMDITPTAHLFGGPQQTIEAIKQRIKKEIGEYITVSVGLSYNKMLAKLASGLQKPNGMVEINQNNLLQIYRTSPLTGICGIGRRVELRLHKLGVYTLIALQSTPLDLLVEEFGSVEGNFLKNVGYGLDDSPVVPYTVSPDVKSVGRNYCLPNNEYNKRKVLQNIYELCEEVSIKLRRLQKTARKVGVYVHGNTSIHGEHTVTQYISRGDDMFQVCLLLLGRSFMNHSYDYIRQISVWSGSLEDEWNTPYSLFEKDTKKDKLAKAIDTLNDKFGDHTIRNGFLLYADKLTTVPNGWMADRYERTKLAQEDM